MKEFLSVRRTFRLKAEEDAQIASEAELCGYQLSSFIRLKLLGRIKGLHIARTPTADLPVLVDALGKIANFNVGIDRIARTLEQIADQLDERRQDLFGLDGCLRELMRISGDARQTFSTVDVAIRQRILVPKAEEVFTDSTPAS